MTYVSGASVIAIGVIFPVLGTISVCLRFAVKRTRKTGLGMDDWLILVGLIFMTGCAVIMIVGSVEHAIGYHSHPSSIVDLYNNASAVQITLEKCEWAFEVLQPLALGFTKLSILFFYRRIFRGRVFNIASWTLIGITAMWVVAFEFASIFDCGTAFYANWGTIKDLKSYCDDSFSELVAYSISDVVIDVLILIMPMPLVWVLQMPMRQKLVVCAILLTGVLAVAAGTVRMVIFCALLVPTLLSSPYVAGVSTDDDLGVISLILFWAMIQMGVAVTVACLPTLRPLFHGVSPESIIRSIRSKISLPSMRSKGPSATDIGKNMPKTSSTESSTALGSENDLWEQRYRDINSIEALAMNIIDRRCDTSEISSGGIHVDRKMSQTVEHV